MIQADLAAINQINVQKDSLRMYCDCTEWWRIEK